MTEACATCGADNELLFTCRHCGRRFCERHELPYHACERFQSGRTPSETAETRATETPETPETPETADTADPAGETPVRDTPSPAPPATEAPVPPASEESADDAAPGEASVRPMDSRRAVGVVSPSSNPQSLGEWLARQTYLTLLFKIGGLALLINFAFYGGVALTLYDPFGII